MIVRIDTSVTHQAIVSLNFDGTWITKRSEVRPASAQTVLPLLEALLKEQSKTLQDVTAVEVHTGPGSFTGLRVGATIAQTLSWILQVPLNGKPPGTLPELLYEQTKYDRTD